MTFTRTSDQPRPRRKRKCAVCREKFGPRSISHRACKPECAQVLAAAKRQKDERKADRQKKRDMRPPKWWKAKAEKAFHAYVRARDEGKPCISCDTILLKLGRLGGDYDAGHFRSVGSSPHLKFDERNVYGQCKHCNDHMASNPQEYERRLRLLKGDAFVDELLADDEPRHLKIADYQRIEATYKAKLAELRKEAA